MNRSDILDEIEDDKVRQHVSDALDSIEMAISDVIDLLDIKGLDDLHKIEDAEIALTTLKDELY